MDLENNVFILKPEEVSATGFPEEIPILQAQARAETLIEMAKAAREQALELMCSPFNRDKALSREINRRVHIMNIMCTQFSRYVEVRDWSTSGIKDLEDFLEDK
jgi:hypothetical protein